MAGMTATQRDNPTAVQVSDGISVKVRITDGNWYQAGACRVWADVHAKATGNVMLEAGTRAGRYYAAAFYFLSTPFWTRAGLNPLNATQLVAVAWWKHATAAPGKPVDLPTL